MEIGLLIKNYTDCKANLECALSYVLDEMSCDIDFSSDTFLSHINIKSSILSLIILDLEHMNRSIEILKSVEKKGV